MTYNFNQTIVSFTILKFSLITNFGLLKTQPNSHESMEISFFFYFCYQLFSSLKTKLWQHKKKKSLQIDNNYCVFLIRPKAQPEPHNEVRFQSVVKRRDSNHENPALKVAHYRNMPLSIFQKSLTKLQGNNDISKKMVIIISYYLFYKVKLVLISIK